MIDRILCAIGLHEWSARGHCYRINCLERRPSPTVRVAEWFLLGLLLVVLSMLTGCITRGEVRAALWLNDGMAPELCEKYPELQKRGFYRVLKDGREEFLSYCHPEALKMSSIHQQDLERLLDHLRPDPKPKSR